MPVEDSGDNLPRVIKSLAQVIECERAKHVDELSALKAQRDAMRQERDDSLHTVKQAKLRYSQLEEDLREEKTHTVRITAAFDLEKVELLKRVEHLQQAATYQADVLTQSRREVEEWKNRYTAVVEDSRREREELSSQFLRMTNRLEELDIWRASPQGSSPTVVISSLSSNKPTSTDESLLSNPRPQPVINSPKTINQVPSSKTITRRQTRLAHPRDAGAASESSIKESSPSRSRHREVSKAGVANASLQKSIQKQGGTSLGTAKIPVSHPVKSPSHPVKSPSHPVKSPLHPTLPPDRVIHTAYFEVKRESDNDDDDPTFPASSVSIASPARDDETTSTTSAKRKRPSIRKQSRIYDGEEQQEDADEVLDQTWARKRLRESEKEEEYDEIAIGAEDNHKEVYGFRKVHVREVNSKPRNTTSRRTTNATQSLGGSSGTKRRVAPTDPAVPNWRRND